MTNHSTIDLTDQEKSNGWTVESIDAYQRERAKAFDVVAGNIVTEYKRGKPAVQMQGAGRSYDPFTRQVR